MDIIFTRKMILPGKRVYLRRFNYQDADTMLKWGQSQRLHKLAGLQKLNNIDEAKVAIRQYMKRKNSYALCLKENDRLIGLVELYERGVDRRSGLNKTKEIGFLLDQDYEHHGYMHEAISLILQNQFVDQEQEEIWAGTLVENLPAQKLLTKLGFKYMYTTDYAQVSDLFSFSEKYYLLKRQEWLKINSNTKS